MNRIDKLFSEKQANILSVYFTAGYPLRDSTVEIIKSLQTAGADMIEIGIPFSDPMADGPPLQKSNQAALKNGMSLKLLFSQLEDIRKAVEIPLLMMGYLNPILQFGVEEFCICCSNTGIDGVIIPDLPPEVYASEFKAIFDKFGIYNILLVAPHTDEYRIKYIDYLSRGFIYLVSSSSVTGGKDSFSDNQIAYFTRIRNMSLSNPTLIGFGISGRNSFDEVCKYSSGGIIGSAFVKIFSTKGEIKEKIGKFICEIKN
jgi:tryptophan synthase alpha chain